MIYHYNNIPPEALKTSPPIGWDLPVLLPGDYKNNVIGLADAAIKIGYFIGITEAKDTENKTK